MKLWSGIVNVQDHRLGVFDGSDDGPGYADVDAGAGDILHTYGDGVLVITTGIAGGPVQVDIELGEGAGSAFGYVDFRSGTLLIEDLESTAVELPEPGPYRVTVVGTGRDAAPDLRVDQVLEAYRILLAREEGDPFALGRALEQASPERLNLLSLRDLE